VLQRMIISRGVAEKKEKEGRGEWRIFGGGGHAWVTREGGRTRFDFGGGVRGW
jgi:hypothetical protein